MATSKELELSKEIDELKEEVKTIDKELQTKNQEVSDLEFEIEVYEEQVSELQDKESFCLDDSPYHNLRGQMVFEKVFKNLNYLPIEELELLIDKHAVV